MTFDETSLKTRFDEAVGTIQPDVTSLTRSSAATGQRLQQRRRVSVVAGVAAVTAMVVGGAAYFGNPSGSLGSPAEPADSGPGVIQPALEASTPRGLAAAVMSHIDGAKLFGASGSNANDVEGVSGPVLMANLGYTFGDKSRYIVSAAASTDPALATAFCTDTARLETCTKRTLDDGTDIYMLQERPKPGGGVEVTTVAAVRPDQVVAVTLLGARAPYGAEMPLSPPELQAIATDPLVGVQTSTAANQRGEGIEPWGGDVFMMAMEGRAGPVTRAPVKAHGDPPQRTR